MNISTTTRISEERDVLYDRHTFEECIRDALNGSSLALSSAFVWADTQEGFAFWSGEHYELERGRPLSKRAKSSLQALLRKHRKEGNLRYYRTALERLEIPGDEFAILVGYTRQAHYGAWQFNGPPAGVMSLLKVALGLGLKVPDLKRLLAAPAAAEEAAKTTADGDAVS